jgi:hypothetical protein
MLESDGVIVLQVAAIISVLCSCSVLLTAALFPTMRKKLFMQIICYISVADLVGNALYIPSYRPSNGSFGCSLEGFINLYAYPVSWLWTTVLMYFLYSLAIKGKLPLSLPIFHVVCWLVPLLFTLLNLTTNTYGRSDDYPDYEVCVLTGDYHDGTIWHTVTYDCLWLACIVVMAYMYCRILCLRRSELAISEEKFKHATKTLGKYPIALFVFWFPHMLSVFALRLVLERYHVTEYYVASLAIKISHGTATTLIFFFDSSEARYNWLTLFQSMRDAVCGPPEEDASRASIGSVDPSRWGDKMISLTFEHDPQEVKRPVFLSSTMAPRFSEAAEERF